jgi:hypothetical protein
MYLFEGWIGRLSYSAHEQEKQSFLFTWSYLAKKLQDEAFVTNLAQKPASPGDLQK